jgi:uncharacterized membrane protein HdeD (DUF308 family)
LHTIAESTITPNLIVGTLAVVAGILLVIFRARVHAWNAGRQRALLGQKRAEAVGKLQSSFWVGFVGVMAVVFGLITITYGIVGIVQNAAI